MTVKAKKTIINSRIYSCHDETRIRREGVLNEMYSFCEKGAKSRTPDLLKRSMKM